MPTNNINMYDWNYPVGSFIQDSSLDKTYTYQQYHTQKWNAMPDYPRIKPTHKYDTSSLAKAVNRMACGVKSKAHYKVYPYTAQLNTNGTLTLYLRQKEHGVYSTAEIEKHNWDTTIEATKVHVEAR